MVQLTVRDVPDDVVERLRMRARAGGRSLEGEVRAVLAAAAEPSREEQLRTADGLAAATAGRPHTDVVELLREDRAR